MRKSTKRKAVNYIGLIILLLVFVLICYHVYNYFFLTIQTEFAVKASNEEKIAITGVICRDEHVLIDNSNGYHDIVLTDGEKVSKSGTVAVIYNNESDVKSQERIRQLQAEVDRYNAAVTAKSSYTGDHSSYDLSIQQALFSYVGALHSGDAAAAQNSLSEFEENVYIKDIVTGKRDDYQQEIVRLNTEISNLKSSVSGNVSNMVSDKSGYYCRTVDGYENTLKPAALCEYSIDQYNQIYNKISNEPTLSEPNVGKIVAGYEWEYYFIVSGESIKNYQVGETINFKFPSVTEDKIQGEIISLTQEGENVLVGVQCQSMHSEFMSARILDGFVITKTYSGIQIDKNSIRIVDGKTGVYVKVGSIIRFKKVDVLYMGSTYAIVRTNENLVEFDEVIVRGKNLYAGKILD